MNTKVKKKNGIKTTGHQLFSVPNNDEGRTFLNLLGKYFNNMGDNGRKRRLLKRGRANNRKSRYASIGKDTYSHVGAGIPHRIADWTAVYICTSYR